MLLLWLLALGCNEIVVAIAWRCLLSLIALLSPVHRIFDTLYVLGIQVIILSKELPTVLFVALSHVPILVCQRGEKLCDSFVILQLRR